MSAQPLPDQFTHAQSAAVHAIKDYICQRFEPIGIVLCGSIVRGEGSPSSDFDVHVIHRHAWQQRIQKVFHGIPAEIFVNPPQQIRRYLTKERARGRPSTAHMLSTGRLIYQTDEVVSIYIKRYTEFCIITGVSTDLF